MIDGLRCPETFYGDDSVFSMAEMAFLIAEMFSCKTETEYTIIRI